MKRLLAIATLLAACSSLLAACSSDSADAEAKAACQAATYAVPGTGTTDTPAKELADFEAASQHAAKAAAMDSRWNNLSTAYLTMVDWWTNVAAQLASDQRTHGGADTQSAMQEVGSHDPLLLSAETQAQTTIHDQCVIGPPRPSDQGA